MSKISPNWSIKTYPDERKARLDAMLGETREVRKALDTLDREIQSAKSGEDYKVIARKAVGNGNYLRKKLGKLMAMVKNEKSNRYLEIKLECAQGGQDFTSSAAEEEAIAYVGPVRLARDIIEAYVVSADNIISICRMNIRDQESYQSNTRFEVESDMEGGNAEN